MDYEKAYKDALERAKLSRLQLLDIGEEATEIEYIFPELAESEDERIRKTLIEFLQKIDSEVPLGAYHSIQGISIEEILAWLEKQGEKPQVDGFDAELNSLLKKYEHLPKKELQEPLEFYLGVVRDDLDIVREEKPKWSEEEIKEAQLDYWRSVGGKEWHGVPVQETIAWLERQSEQVVILHKFKVGDWIVSKWGGIYQIKEVMSGSYNLLCTNNAEEINSITQVDNNSRLLCMGDIKNLESQGKQKWSEEDENFFTNICTIIDADRNFTESAKRRSIDWLKSLKQRMEE